MRTIYSPHAALTRHAFPITRRPFIFCFLGRHPVSRIEEFLLLKFSNADSLHLQPGMEIGVIKGPISAYLSHYPDPSQYDVHTAEINRHEPIARFLIAASPRESAICLLGSYSHVERRLAVETVVASNFLSRDFPNVNTLYQVRWLPRP